MKNKKVAVIILIVSILLIIGGIILIFVLGDKEIKYGDFTIASYTGEYTKYDKKLYVEGYKGSYDYAFYITGTLNSEKDHNFTVITFDLYDKSNKLLGTAVAGLNTVKANKKYEFKALSLVDSNDAKKVVKYKLNSIK